MTFLEIPVSRRQECTVIIAMPPGVKPTSEVIRAAAAATLEPYEWDQIGEVDHGKPKEVSAEFASEYRYHDLTATATPPPSLAARCREIGISTVTGRKWRDLGVDVFSDKAVKTHVSRQRVHNWKIAERFKPRLEP